MVTRQTLVVVSVVLLATLAVMVPAVSAAPAASGDGPADQSAISQAALQDGDNETDTDSDDEQPFGNQMAAFMQSNAAQTEDTVEHGMWESAFERANESERARLAQNRTAELNDRLAELRERNQTLHERYRNGSISHDEYVAEASRLSGRIEALEGGVNGTANAADRAGLNVSALDELRTNARNMSGPEVAGVARSLTSGDQGPPEEIPGNGPPGDDDTERPDNGPPEDVPGGGNANVGDNETIAPENQTRGDTENTPRGPDDPGNGDDAGQGQGNGGGDAGPDDGAPGGGDDGAPGNGQSGDDTPGNSEPGANSPGNDGDDASGNNDDEGDRGNNGAGNSSGGNSGGGDSAGGNSGQGNSGDDPGGGPSSVLTTDMLFSH